jgi:hypothetical protein
VIGVSDGLGLSQAWIGRNGAFIPLSQSVELGFYFSLNNYMQDAVKCEGTTEMTICILLWNHVASLGRNGVFCIATLYGLDGAGIEFRWRRDFPHLSRRALGLTQPPMLWVPGLSRGYCDRDMALTSHRI